VFGYVFCFKIVVVSRYCYRTTIVVGYRCSFSYVTLLLDSTIAHAYNDAEVARSQSPPVAAPSASPAMFRQFPLRGSITRMFVGLIRILLSNIIDHALLRGKEMAVDSVGLAARVVRALSVRNDKG